MNRTYSLCVTYAGAYTFCYIGLDGSGTTSLRETPRTHEKAIQIEGGPDSLIPRGRLRPKGSASEQLVNSPGRQTKVLYCAH